MRITILTIIMTLTCSTASADKYSRAWKKVDKLIESDLPESAAKEINAIWDMSVKDNNSRQMLKSLVYLTRVRQTSGEKPVTEGIELFQSLLPKLRVQEHKALCHAFIAKGYIRYKENNRFRLENQAPSDIPNPPIEMWTLKMITDTICYHLNQSILLAGDVASGYYEEFFPGGNKDGLKLRPQLADMLMDDAMSVMTRVRLIKSKRTFLDDERLYGNANGFLQAVRDLKPDDPDLWQFYVLKLLTQNNMSSKPSIRTTIDLRRMRLLAEYLDQNSPEWNRNYDRWLQGCIDMASGYEKKVKFSTLFYSLAASELDRHISDFEDDPEKMSQMRRNEHDICVAAQRKWPKSEGAFECMRIRRGMERPGLTMTREGDFTVGERNLAMLTYRNINTAYFKVVEVPSQYTGKSNEELIPDLNRATAVAEWSMRLEEHHDWLDHYVMVDIPPVMQGCYYLMASTGPYFNSTDNIAFAYMECNGLGLAQTVAGNGAFSGIVVNLKTGEPVGSCRYTVWQVNYRNELVKVATRGFSADDGFISIEGLENANYRIELEQGANRGNSTFYAPWSGDIPDRNTLRLFTDRYTYLPGDSVQFTGIEYFSDGYNRGRVQNQRTIDVMFRDINWKVIERVTLTTDSMGVIKGSFRIPENVVPGRATLSATGRDDACNCSKAINIETFRQPKFEVKLDNLTETPHYNSTIRINGHAESLTGVPVDGAKVIWNACISAYSVHPFSVRDGDGGVRIGNGETKTGSDGGFVIDLTVPDGMLISDDCLVTVFAQVTDLNGETHDRNLTFNVGVRNNITVDSRIISNANGMGLDMDVWLLSGNAVNGNVHVNVSRLLMEPRLLPLPFSVSGKRMISELTRITDNQNLRERFKRYGFDFGTEPAVNRTVLDTDIKVTSDAGGHVSLEGLESGIYRITATSGEADEYEEIKVLVRDDDYNLVPQNEYLWCDGYGSGELKAEVGDTVKLRVSSCLPGAVIHYFVENRFGTCGYGSIRTNGKQQTISIPVTDEMKGMFAVDLGLAYQGYTENKSVVYTVQDRSKQLDVELVTFRDMLEPDSREEWKLRVTDAKGNPVVAAIMMDMFDSALDRYGHNIWFFMPWSRVYVGTDNLFQSRYRYFSLYQPWIKAETGLVYKGKIAITGTLMDPFNYYPSHMFEGVGMTVIDEALQGRVAGLDIVFDSGDLGARSNMKFRGVGAEMSQAGVMMTGADDGLEESIPDEVVTDGDYAPVTLRTDMNPTGLFEYLVTDKDGYATVRFDAPQLLTRWNLQGFAFTDSLLTGSFRETVTTRKQIMVEPSAPRFLRQGDRMEFTFKVSNLTDKDVKAKLSLTFTDALTGKTLKLIEGLGSKTVTVPANGSLGSGFTVNVPAGLTAVTYRITAQTTGHSDGMQETIPVLSNRTQVVQAQPLFNNGQEMRKFVFGELAGLRSNTIADEQLVLEYSASPIWYAVQALPSLIILDDPSNLRLFHRYLGASISDNLSSRYPAIRDMLDEWSNLPASEWETQLERNEKLTGTLMEETPWLCNSVNEQVRLRWLAKSLGTADMKTVMQEALNRLLASQLPDGGWPWIEGSPSNIGITREIIQGFGLLIENGVVEPSEEIVRAVEKGLNYIDSYIYDICYNFENRSRFIGYSELDYLITRSYFQQYKFIGNTRESYRYFLDLAQEADTHNMPLNFRAQLALLMSRLGKNDKAKEIAASLVERSLYSDEMGRYWRDNAAGVLRSEAPVENQSLIIRVLLATGFRTQAVEAARWLLKQRQTTSWGSSPSTAAAVVALMATGGDAQLESDPDITIYVGKEAVKASDSKATGGYTTHTWQGPIGRDKADITVESKTPGISWGAVYRIFTEEMEKVESNGSGMTLKRTIWRVVHGDTGDRLEQVDRNTRLRTGDVLRVQFDISTDRNLEYVQLSDMRAATVEPVSTAAGYRYNWRDDIGYYDATGYTRNVFYIERLSKGSYRLEYEVKVQKPGRFNAGIAVIQCLYAPQFRATTTSATLTVAE